MKSARSTNNFLRNRIIEISFEGVMNFGTEGGAKLAGIWQNNQKHGAGLMICGNGVTLQCNPLFVNDKPVHWKSVNRTVEVEDEVREDKKKKDTKNGK